jgi:uncharacterized protein
MPAMAEADLSALTRQLLWLAFGLGLLFGAVAQRSQFCTMGAVADVVTMGSFSRLRMWALAAGVAVLGFNALVGLGLVRAADSVYAGASLTWLSLLVGGGLFGVGMVLASGCASKNLVRLGGGSLKALVVALVMGLAAWATLRGVTALLRVRTVDAVTLDLTVGQDLPRLAAHALSGEPQTWAWILGAVLGGLLVVWAIWSREDRGSDWWLGGLGIGVLVVAAWWLSGVHGHLTEHPVTLEAVFLGTRSHRMESFSFVAPVAYGLEYLVFASDTSRTLTQGVVASSGVVLGSAVVALASGRFRWEGFADAADLGRHLVGAVLMGVGGVTALGCTIGQGLSGLSTLSVGSMLALAAIIGGAVLALRWQIWQLERQA